MLNIILNEMLLENIQNDSEIIWMLYYSKKIRFGENNSSCMDPSPWQVNTQDQELARWIKVILIANPLDFCIYQTSCCNKYYPV